jgi:hypothetical protein
MATQMSNQVGLPAPDLPPAKNNLLDVASRGPAGERWERGGGFTEFACLEGFVQSPACPPADLSDPQECQPAAYFSPVLLEMSIKWDSLTYGDAQKAAIEALERGTSSLLEAEVELGTAAAAAVPAIVNPKLSDAPVVGAPTTPDAAIGIAQDYIYRGDAAAAPPVHTTGGLGTLLMSYETAVLARGGLDDTDSGDIVTRFGRWPVVIGNFTPGIVYGVPGLIDVYLDEIEVVEHFERTDNQMIVSAQRLALVTFHTCAMVQVPLP